MSFNSRVKNAQNALTSTLFGTSAAPQTVAGNSVLMSKVAPGTMTAHIVAICKTSTLTMAPKWQVSDDGGGTWYDVKSQNNAAYVTFTAGTGSSVTTTIELDGPISLSGHRLARAVVFTGVTTADGLVDAASVQYSWLQSDLA
jgi:hypothetical protein